MILRVHPHKVASALLKGDVDEDQASLQSGAVSNGGDSRTAAAVVKSLAYLRDRVSYKDVTSPLHPSVAPSI